MLTKIRHKGNTYSDTAEQARTKKPALVGAGSVIALFERTAEGTTFGAAFHWQMYAIFPAGCYGCAISGNFSSSISNIFSKERCISSEHWQLSVLDRYFSSAMSELSICSIFVPLFWSSIVRFILKVKVQRYAIFPASVNWLPQKLNHKNKRHERKYAPDRYSG